MATSAFKSTSRRSSFTPLDDASSSSSSSNRTGLQHRRSRSLSRFSNHILDLDSDEVPAPRGRFVNTVRGSAGFPEVSLEDLANDLFPMQNAEGADQNERGRSSRRNSLVGPSQSRARSVSRQRSRVGDGKGNLDNTSTLRGKGIINNTSRRRRSLSVARCQFSDSESHSSALTDDEARDNRSDKDGIDGTIRVVYAQKKTGYPTGAVVETGLYESMRKELRHAVEEIRMELEQVMVNSKPSGLPNSDCVQSNNLDVLQAVALIRKNCTTKLEQSEKRKQDLLAEIVLEEQRGHELSKIVRELLPDTRNTAVTEMPSHARTSSDRSKISQRLTEEAEKYFEDFLSNVEDTDISSVDGEKSDASSKVGGRTKLSDHVMHCVGTERFCIPETSTSLPVEMDGVRLPWLQWGTCNNDSPLLCKSTAEVPVTPQDDLRDALQGASAAYSKSNSLKSSHESWSPGGDGPSLISREDTGSSYSSQSVAIGLKASDVDDYLYDQRSEDLIFECWRQRSRRDSGGLILCTGAFL